MVLRAFVAHVDTIEGKEVAFALHAAGYTVYATHYVASSIKPSFVHDIVEQDGSDAFRWAVLACAVVVVDLARTPDAALAVADIVAAAEQDRVFVALSTVMAWCRTELPPLDEDEYEPLAWPGEEEDEEEDLDEEEAAALAQARAADPLTPWRERRAAARGLVEDLAPRRLAEPSARAVLSAERALARRIAAGGPLSSASIVVAGLAYGQPGGPLDPLFETAFWMEPPPLYGSPDRALPLVHVSDLAAAVLQLTREPLEDADNPFVLAVDAVQPTAGEVTEAIAQAAGPGTVTPVPERELVLIQDIERLCVNLSVRPERYVGLLGAAMELGYEPAAPLGLVPVAPGVAGAWLRARGIAPLTLVVAGPPGPHRAAVVAAIADEYSLPVVTMRDAFQRVAADAPAVADAPVSAKGKRPAKRPQPAALGPLPSGPAAVAAAAAAALASGTALGDVDQAVLAAVMRHYMLIEPEIRVRGAVLIDESLLIGPATATLFVPEPLSAAEHAAVRAAEADAAAEAKAEAEDEDEDDYAAALGTTELADHEAAAPWRCIARRRTRAEAAPPGQQVPAPALVCALAAASTEAAQAAIVAAAAEGKADAVADGEELARTRAAWPSLLSGQGAEARSVPLAAGVADQQGAAAYAELTPEWVAADPSATPEAVVAAVRAVVGRPHNLGRPRAAEAAREEARRAAEAAEQKAAADAKAAQQAEAEAAAAARQAEYDALVADLSRQEQEALTTKAMPAQDYLESHFGPHLAEGMRALAAASPRPENPLSFLGRWLMKRASELESSVIAQ